MEFNDDAIRYARARVPGVAICGVNQREDPMSQIANFDLVTGSICFWFGTHGSERVLEPEGVALALGTIGQTDEKKHHSYRHGCVNLSSYVLFSARVITSGSTPPVSRESACAPSPFALGRCAVPIWNYAVAVRG